LETTNLSLEPYEIEYLISLCDYVLGLTQGYEHRTKIMVVRQKLTSMLEPPPEPMKPLTTSLTVIHAGFMCKACGTTFGTRSILRRHAKHFHRDRVK
jgi:hypothetical protein